MIKKLTNFLSDYFLGLHIPTEYAYGRYQRKEFKGKSKAYDVVSYVGEFAEMGLCRILPTTLEIGAAYHAMKGQDHSFFLLFAFLIAENTRLISVYSSFLRKTNRNTKYKLEILKQRMEESYKKFEKTNQEISDVIIDLEEWDEDDEEDDGDNWKGTENE
ncbi:hypothetical protein HZA97_06170 [Candidatus Woesearchaeota archaeon]|nr:hypothetical protein [Candidatus Woesearchaeota archaeon]